MANSAGVPSGLHPGRPEIERWLAAPKRRVWAGMAKAQVEAGPPILEEGTPKIGAVLYSGVGDVKEAVRQDEAPVL